MRVDVNLRAGEQMLAIIATLVSSCELSFLFNRVLIILSVITVEGLHKEFARAGADVLQAFTYAANDRMEKVFDISKPLLKYITVMIDLLSLSTTHA
jgi:S-methylmethionine-dependent homocysteine/selenocysteine methylase